MSVGGPSLRGPTDRGEYRPRQDEEPQMQTMTERFAPLTEAEVREAVPMHFAIGPDSPRELGESTLVVLIPSRSARLRIEQKPVECSFETTMWWAGAGVEATCASERAQEVLESLVCRAGEAYAQIVYSDATSAAVIAAISPRERVDFESPAPGHEHMVPVVFDVLAPDRRRAAEVVAEVLALTEGSGLRQAFDRANRTARSTMVEAWWFPEASDKPVDRNDRPDMWLQDGSEAEVRASECEEVQRLLQQAEGLPGDMVERLSAALEDRAERLREDVHAVL